MDEKAFVNVCPARIRRGPKTFAENGMVLGF